LTLILKAFSSKGRRPADVNEELFFELVSNFFIPCLDAVRASPVLDTETAILLISQEAGTDLNIVIQPFRIRVVRQTPRENPTFKAVRHRNVLFEERSRRRPLQQFEIINSEFVQSKTSSVTI
jgi:hypothetical protein